MEATNANILHATESGVARDITNDVGVASGRLDFDDFYRTHVGPICRAVAITLGDDQLAEDAVNEAMVRALQRWKRVADFDNPSGWVYRVALNWALSWKRRRRRERERPISYSAETTEIALRDDSLTAALDGLSIDHRAVVVCRYFLDWSTTQTAAALDIAEGTVKSRLARALDAIRNELGEDR